MEAGDRESEEKPHDRKPLCDKGVPCAAEAAARLPNANPRSEADRQRPNWEDDEKRGEFIGTTAAAHRRFQREHEQHRACEQRLDERKNGSEARMSWAGTRCRHISLHESSHRQFGYQESAADSHAAMPRTFAS